ncbi:hypothetical protein BKP35_06560 [Anaerobacillus arseniciselenatis]|uniref:Recombinase XerC n=1 Tax=Anaerobacillus arseniciselenatis TaxID=85682 RepID=A0A1S2LT44_9BACI|nr:tyrosine-type recombinase/integrase [Anaerobacillus arseniciselenatis]OIJ14535.1 hypothetical protein BKP35_06560 [Anaerobacillus arseniciselenatis]
MGLRKNDHTEQIIDSFSDYLLAKGRSENTLKTYVGVLCTFSQWLEANDRSLVDVTSQDVQAYMNYLETEQRSASTINKIYNTINTFAKSINKSEIMNEIQRIEKDPRESNPPEPLDKNSLQQLLEKIKTDGNKRNIAIVYLLRHTGVRVSELCALHRSNIQLSNQTGKLIVRNNNGERVIPLPNECIQHVKEYLDSRDDQHEALFLSKSKKPLSVRTVQHTLQQYGVHPKKLRHTFCYELVGKGLDLSVVAQLAGHSDVNLTRQYVQDEKAM